MIRLRKDTNIPLSLQSVECNKYDDEDVRKTLYTDQDGKCYLCEQKTGKSFEIEHLKAKAEGFYPELKFTWSNLFLACPYCNGRKPNHLVNLPNPVEHNIEDLIEQCISFSRNKVEFKSKETSISICETIDLLDKLLNGKFGIRDVKANILYKDIEREIVFF